MSFGIDFTKLQENAEKVQINKIVKNKLSTINPARPNEDVEIFTNIAYGKVVS